MFSTNLEFYHNETPQTLTASFLASGFFCFFACDLFCFFDVPSDVRPARPFMVRRRGHVARKRALATNLVQAALTLLQPWVQVETAGEGALAFRVAPAACPARRPWDAALRPVHARGPDTLHGLSATTDAVVSSHLTVSTKAPPMHDSALVSLFSPVFRLEPFGATVCSPVASMPAACPATRSC